MGSENHPGGFGRDDPGTEERRLNGISAAARASLPYVVRLLCYLVDRTGTHALSDEQAETMLTALPGVEIHWP